MSIIYRALRTLHAARREQAEANPARPGARRIRLAAANRYLLTPVGLLVLLAAAAVSALAGVLAWEWASQRLGADGALVSATRAPVPEPAPEAVPADSPPSGDAGQASGQPAATLQVPPAPPGELRAPVPAALELDQARVGTGVVPAPPPAPAGPRAQALPAPPPASEGAARPAPEPAEGLSGSEPEAGGGEPAPQVSLELPGQTRPADGEPLNAAGGAQTMAGPPASRPRPEGAGDVARAPQIEASTRADAAAVDSESAEGPGAQSPGAEVLGLEMPARAGAPSGTGTPWPSEGRRPAHHLLPGQRALPGRPAVLPAPPAAPARARVAAAHEDGTGAAARLASPVQEPAEPARPSVQVRRQSRVAQAVAALNAALAANEGERVRGQLQVLAEIKGENNPYVLKMRGYWALLQGRHDSARRLLARALELRPGDLDAGLNMAVLEQRVGEEAAARTRVTRLAEAHPGDERTQELRRRLR